MKLVRKDELIHVGGVTYDAYNLCGESGEILCSRTRVGAEGTEFYVKHRESFQKHWSKVAQYHFRILKDSEASRGYLVEFWVERQFNTAPETVELD